MRYRESQKTGFTYEKEVSKIEEECGEDVKATLSGVRVLKVTVVLLVFQSLQSLHYHSARKKNITYSCGLLRIVLFS